MALGEGQEHISCLRSEGSSGVCSMETEKCRRTGEAGKGLLGHHWKLGIRLLLQNFSSVVLVVLKTQLEESLVVGHNLSLFIRPLIPSWGSTLLSSSKSNHLPKSHLQMPSLWGLEVSIYEFWGDTNIWSTVIPFLKIHLKPSLSFLSLFSLDREGNEHSKTRLELSMLHNL